MVALEIGKRLFFSYHSSGYYVVKKLHQKLESYRFNTNEKIGLIGLVQVEIKSHNLKNAHFKKKSTKDKNIIILHFMTDLHNLEYRLVEQQGCLDTF